MARQRKRKSRHDAVRQQNVVGVTLLVLALALIGGAVWYYFANPALALDKETYCPLANTGDHSVTAVLIDTTDRLSPVQQQVFLNKFQELKQSMNRFDRLDIFAVDHVTQNVLRPVFSLCNPGRGSEIDPLLGNPRLVEKKWREGFDGPLEEILREMMGRNKANSSPIMESIQSVTVTSLAPSLRSSSKHLVIVSDMLQHSSIYSHYKGNMEFEEFRGSPEFESVYANMRSIEVSIWYLRREGMQKTQGIEHVKFWEQYFEAYGASLTYLKKL